MKWPRHQLAVDAVVVDGVGVQFDAEAGAFGNGDLTVDRLERGCEEIVAQRVFADIILQQPWERWVIAVGVIRQRCEKVDGCDQAYRTAPAMGRVVEIVDLTEGGDALGLIEAAAKGQVRLQNERG